MFTALPGAGRIEEVVHSTKEILKVEKGEALTNDCLRVVQFIHTDTHKSHSMTIRTRWQW